MVYSKYIKLWEVLYVEYKFEDALEHDMWLEVSLDDDGYFGKLRLVQGSEALWSFNLDAVNAGGLYEGVNKSLYGLDSFAETKIKDSLGTELGIYKGGTPTNPTVTIALFRFDRESDICWLSLNTARKLLLTLDAYIIGNLSWL